VDNKINLVVATHTINRNDLTLGEARSKKENLGVAIFTVLWIKATIMEGKLPNV
jgi:hypothetical protein